MVIFHSYVSLPEGMIYRYKKQIYDELWYNGYDYNIDIYMIIWFIIDKLL